jgi:hypothetical protein
MTSTEEEVEDLLEDLTEYDDIETMLEDLDEDVELDSLDDDGEVFAED